jgi:DNA-binding transcriptional MocR family regulator
MDAEGMLPEALEEACQLRRPRLLYLVPTIQNPTTATMSAQRRQALLAVAKRHDLTVIEDDPYWLLAGDAAPPLAAHRDAGCPVITSPPVQVPGTGPAHRLPGGAGRRADGTGAGRLLRSR